MHEAEETKQSDHRLVDIWEAYALLVLQYLDSNLYCNLIFCDKPDLISESDGLGVEVTSAIESDDREADSLYEKYCSSTDDDERSRYRDSITRKKGYRVEAGFLSYPGRADSFSNILKVHRIKLAKLNGGGYRIFGHNHLYIRSDILASPAMLEDALSDFTEQSTGDVFFDCVIVNVPGHIYVFDLQLNRVDDVPFPSKDQYEIAERAILLAEGCLQ